MNWQDILLIISSIIAFVEATIIPFIVRFYKKANENVEEVIISFQLNHKNGLRDGELIAQVKIDTKLPAKLILKIYEIYQVKDWK